MNPLIINQGGIYWVDAEPHKGREEGGHNSKTGNIRRPFVVVSNNSFNATGMGIVFPIISKHYPSQFLHPIMLQEPSSIILTQILCYDMVARRAEYMGISVSNEELEFLKQVVIHML